MNNRVAVVVLPIFLLIVSSCGILKKPKGKNVSINSIATGAVVDTTAAQNSTAQDPGVAIDKVPVQPEVVVTEPAATTPATEPNLTAEKQALVDQLMPLWNKSVDYKTFKGKAKMHYKGSGMDQDFTANIRIAKDSMMWIHVTAGMGIVNVARILITPDSFKMMNYLDKTAISKPITEVKKLLPVSVDFSVLQNLIVGEALSRSGKPTDATDFGSTWTLSIADPEVTQQANYSKADSTMRTLQVLSSTESGFAGMIQYGNYSVVNSRMFAISRAINFTADEKPHYFDMNFNNASFDEALDYPFAIPESYTLNK